MARTTGAFPDSPATRRAAAPNAARPSNMPHCIQPFRAPSSPGGAVRTARASMATSWVAALKAWATHRA